MHRLLCGNSVACEPAQRTEGRAKRKVGPIIAFVSPPFVLDFVDAQCVSCSFCDALRDTLAEGGAGGGGAGGGMRRYTVSAVWLKSAEMSGWGSRMRHYVARQSLVLGL